MATEPHIDHANWKKVYQLLQSGNYEQAAELLRTAESTTLQAGHPLIAMTAGASRQICLALIAYRAEIEWHQLARGNAELRERTLSQHVLAMLALIGDQASPKDSLPATNRESVFATHPILETEEPISLWQRIQNLFGRQQLIHPPQQGQALLPYSPEPLTPLVEKQPIAPATETSPPESAPPNQQIGEPALEPLRPEDYTPTSSELTEVASAGEPAEPGPTTQVEKPEAEQEPSMLTIYCLGPFRVVQNGEEIEEWNGQKGVSILKYLIAHHGTTISKDVLMDVFWPNANPEAARRNLHQAIYSLRQTLRRSDPGVQHIRYENNQYLLNPELKIWVDAEEFEKHLRAGQRLQAAGQQTEAMAEYSIADSLYQGDFLGNDVFEDWIHAQREHLRGAYLEMADHLGKYYLQQGEHAAAIALNQKVLMLDNCDEESHRRLMRCYLAQGQRHLAIRQYHSCVQSLQDELDVSPSEETTDLYEQIMSQR